MRISPSGPPIKHGDLTCNTRALYRWGKPCGSLRNFCSILVNVESTRRNGSSKATVHKFTVFPPAPSLTKRKTNKIKRTASDSYTTAKQELLWHWDDGGSGGGGGNSNFRQGQVRQDKLM